jgi:hypothetical protein
MCARLAMLAGLVALSGCEPRSSVPEGDHQALRYLLPDDYVEIMEGADRVVMYAFGPPVEMLAGQPRPALPCGERAGSPIIGSVEERDRRAIVFTAHHLYSAILDAGGSTMCATPEYVLRFERGARSIEFQMTEECNLAFIHHNDELFRPSVSVTHLGWRRFASAAAELRRRCGAAALPMDESLLLQYHDGIRSDGICCEPTM